MFQTGHRENCSQKTRCNLEPGNFRNHRRKLCQLRPADISYFGRIPWWKISCSNGGTKPLNIWGAMYQFRHRIFFPWKFVILAMPLIWQPSSKIDTQVSSGTPSISVYHGATDSARRKSDVKWGMYRISKKLPGLPQCLELACKRKPDTKEVSVSYPTQSPPTIPLMLGVFTLEPSEVQQLPRWRFHL